MTVITQNPSGPDKPGKTLNTNLQSSTEQEAVDSSLTSTDATKQEPCTTRSGSEVETVTGITQGGGMMGQA